MEVNFSDEGTKYSEASGNKIPWGTYLRSQLLIKTTNPDPENPVEIWPQISARADRLTHLCYWAEDFTERFHWFLDMLLAGAEDDALANTNRIIQGAGFLSVSVINRLWADLFPQAILLPVSYSNNHHLNMLRRACSPRVQLNRWTWSALKRPRITTSQSECLCFFVHIWMKERGKRKNRSHCISIRMFHSYSYKL